MPRTGGLDDGEGVAGGGGGGEMLERGDGEGGEVVGYTLRSNDSVSDHREQTRAMFERRMTLLGH